MLGLIQVLGLISAFFTEVYVSINSSISVFQAVINTTDTKIKMKRVGNDCQVLSSSDGVELDSKAHTN